MGFLRPKTPPPPPPPAPLPPVPAATRAELPGESTEMINQTMKRKRSGYTKTILTSKKGVEEDPQVYTKTLLGG
jgi:hypothetical protein|tara:strand:- start:879 stop:1100 length:222 start_codon:yes stop_codon:yes gene_type:complete